MLFWYRPNSYGSKTGDPSGWNFPENFLIYLKSLGSSFLCCSTFYVNLVCLRVLAEFKLVLQQVAREGQVLVDDCFSDQNGLVLDTVSWKNIIFSSLDLKMIPNLSKQQTIFLARPCKIIFFSTTTRLAKNIKKKTSRASKSSSRRLNWSNQLVWKEKLCKNVSINSSFRNRTFSLLIDAL